MAASECPAQLAAQKDVAGDVQVFGQVGLLMNDLNAQSAHHVRAKDAHALPVEIHVAAVRRIQTGQHADEHRLARSAAPGQSDDFARRHVQADLRKRGQRAKVFGEIDDS